MQKLLTTLLIIQWAIINIQLKAQTTEPILRLNTQMHTTTINRISSDAAGKYILTASLDKTAKLWNATSGDLLKTFRPPIGHGKAGMLYAGALSPNGKIAAVAGWTKNDDIYLFNTSTGEIQQKLTGLGGRIMDLEFSSKGDYLAAALGGGEGVVIYEQNFDKVSNFVKVKTLSGYGKSSYNITFDYSGRLATVCFDGKIRLYDKYFKLKKIKNGAGTRPFSIAFSPDGSKLAIGYEDAPDIDIFSGKKLKLLYKAKLDGMNENGGLNKVSFSADGKYLYGGGYYSKYIDGNWWSHIRRWTNAGQGSYRDYPACSNTIMDIKISTSGDIFFAGYQPDFGRMNKYGDKLFYKAGEINNFANYQFKYFKTNYSADKIAFTPKGKEAMLFSVADRNLTGFQNLSGFVSYTDNKSGVRVSNWKDTYSPKINGNKISFLKQYERCRSTDISPNGNKIILGADFNIYCANTKGNKLWKAPIQVAAWAVNISGNGKLVTAVLHNGVINWYSMSNGELLLTLYAHPDNKRWILYTPEGYFDASQGAENLVGWHVNQAGNKAAKFHPLSQFYEKYYTPGLGARVLAGEKINKEKNSLKNFKLPPLVEITSPKKAGDLRGITPFGANLLKSTVKDIQVTVKITDQGGGIDEIRLYLNGKLVETTHRGFKPRQQENTSKTKTFTISLLNGENKIKATAFNTQRTESLADEITVFYEGVKKTANLYMLVIGIDNYKNPKYKLNYALADAKAFGQEIEKGSSSIFGKTNIVFLSDAQATKIGIMKAFDKLKTQAQANDVFIFYYAGHGVMSEEDKAQFYIVPYDVTQLYGNNDLLKSKAVSGNELQDFATKLKARKQMFVLDACQSGGIVDMLASRGAAEEKAISQLARSTGTFWLTASGTKQFATEFKELGHGVFTYAILQAIKGKADGGSKDRKITVKEISAFLNDKVPELSKKYKGTAQYPTSYGFGQDFPVIIIK